VDIGVHQDGLVHVSQLADRYVRDPNDVVKVGQKVKVTVQSVDLARGANRAHDAQSASAAR
jgi:protein Tex